MEEAIVDCLFRRLMRWRGAEEEEEEVRRSINNGTDVLNHRKLSERIQSQLLVCFRLFRTVVDTIDFLLLLHLLLLHLCSSAKPSFENSQLELHQLLLTVVLFITGISSLPFQHLIVTTVM